MDNKKYLQKQSRGMLKHIPLSIYLSIFQYVVTTEGGIRRVPVNQVLGVVFLRFFLCEFFSSVNSLRIEITILRLYGVMKNISWMYYVREAWKLLVYIKLS